MGRNTYVVEFKDKKFKAKYIDASAALAELKNGRMNIEELNTQGDAFFATLYNQAMMDRELTSFVELAAKAGLTPYDCVKQALQQHKTRRIFTATRTVDQDRTEATQVQNRLEEHVNTRKVELHNLDERHHYHHHHDHHKINTHRDVRNVDYLQQINHQLDINHYPQTQSQEHNLIQTIRHQLIELPTINTSQVIHGEGHRAVPIRGCGDCYETGVTRGLTIPSAEDAELVYAKRFAQYNTNKRVVGDKIRKYVNKGDNVSAYKLANTFGVKGEDCGYTFDVTPTNVVVHEYQCPTKTINHPEKVVRHHTRSHSQDAEKEVHVHNVHSATVETRPVRYVNVHDHHHDSHHHRHDHVVRHHHHHTDVPIVIENHRRDHTHHHPHNKHTEEHKYTRDNASTRVEQDFQHRFDDPVRLPREFVPDCEDGKCDNHHKKYYHDKQAMGGFQLGPMTLPELVAVYQAIQTTSAFQTRELLDLLAMVGIDATRDDATTAYMKLLAYTNGDANATTAAIQEIVKRARIPADVAKRVAPRHVRAFELFNQGRLNEAFFILSQ